MALKEYFVLFFLEHYREGERGREEFYYLNFYHYFSLDHSSPSQTCTHSLSGLLSPLSNLSLQYGRTLTFLSWLPPFSLDGLDIRYAVSLSNESHTFSFSLVNVNGFNISSMKYLSSCSVYNFTVQPLNNVGVSTETSIVQFFPGGKLK